MKTDSDGGMLVPKEFSAELMDSLGRGEIIYFKPIAVIFSSELSCEWAEIGIEQDADEPEIVKVQE